MRPTAPAASISFVLIAMMCWPAFGQDAGTSPWTIQSPASGQTILAEELFVAAAFDENLVDPSSIRLYLDDAHVKGVRNTQGAIRYLHGKTLGPGPHRLRIESRSLTGADIAAFVWTFTVEGPFITNASASPGSGVKVRGQTGIDIRGTDLTGLGALRQEPGQTYALRADVVGEYGNISFPLNLYLSTDDSPLGQSTNRFRFGMVSRPLTILVGDVTPKVSTLLMNGARARGTSVNLRLAPVGLSFVYGTLRRGVEGLVVEDGLSGIPTSALGGTFKRFVTAGRLEVGSRETARFSVHGLKAWDDVHSIEQGRNPVENIVVGSDLKLRLKPGRLRLDAGTALSIVTEDISRGAATKAEIDSLFSIDIPVDPADWNWLITINATTVPLRPDKLSSLAWYVTGQGQAEGHHLRADLRSVGSAYFSAANPYLIGDRLTLSLTDRFMHRNGALSGTLNYRHYRSLNSSDLTLPELTGYQAGAQFDVRPKPAGPRLSGGYRYLSRKRTFADSTLRGSDARVGTMSAGVSDDFTSGGWDTSGEIFWSRSDRTNKTLATGNSTTNSLTAGLRSKTPGPIVLSARYSYLLIALEDSEGRSRQPWHTINFGTDYQADRRGIEAGFKVRFARALESRLLPPSRRYGLSINARYEIDASMSVELVTGFDSFKDLRDTDLKYTERFIVLRHRYRF